MTGRSGPKQMGPRKPVADFVEPNSFVEQRIAQVKAELSVYERYSNGDASIIHRIADLEGQLAVLQFKKEKTNA